MDFVNKQQNNSDKNDDEPKDFIVTLSILSITSATKMEKNTYCN
jgi:hypothetical protein